MSWSAAQYSQFEADRTRPVRDLVGAMPALAGARAADLGCGPGNSTAVLLERFPAAAVTGVDSSADMLAAARKRLPAVCFVQADIAAWDDEGRFGAILSNAALHWLGDHAALLPRLVAKLEEGGSLAVQMPDNLAEPVYDAMRAAAAAAPWAERLAPITASRHVVHAAEAYYRILKPHCRRVDLWRTTYQHVMAGPDGIVEWFKGSGLRPYLDALDPAEGEAFLAAVRDEIARRHALQPDGTCLLPFPRVFFVATR